MCQRTRNIIFELMVKHIPKLSLFYEFHSPTISFFLYLLETESVELASYRLHDVAANWYESWLLCRGEGAPPAVWDEFTGAFLAHFLPPEVRRAREDRFLMLRQRGRSVREYSLGF